MAEILITVEQGITEVLIEPQDQPGTVVNAEPEIIEVTVEQLGIMGPPGLQGPPGNQGPPGISTTDELETVPDLVLLFENRLV